MKLPVIIPSRNAETIAGNIVAPHVAPLSPLLGVDPQIMYNTIREVGPEHFTLSSDAGEPLFPDSVEAMRLVRGYMEAFGLHQDELYTVCTRNPAKVAGLELN
jgi:predicted metal-dependent TIM-barrel fold hydrolase